MLYCCTISSPCHLSFVARASCKRYGLQDINTSILGAGCTEVWKSVEFYTTRYDKYMCTRYLVRTQYTVHSTQYTVHSTQYTVQSTIFNYFTHSVPASPQYSQQRESKQCLSLLPPTSPGFLLREYFPLTRHNFITYHTNLINPVSVAVLLCTCTMYLVPRT